jgi:hypothetical protein
LFGGAMATLDTLDKLAAHVAVVYALSALFDGDEPRTR